MPPVDSAELRRLALAAGEGDAAALETAIAQVRDGIYRLALRMLWHSQDAEDATQEALIRIMSHIATYRGEAAFSTWAYRVASNHILNWRQSRVEQQNLTFQRFAEELHEGLADPDPTTSDAALLVAEVKLGCTLGMLQCLDRDHRLAYVLSDVFDLSSADAAYICETTPAAFRKRTSRARAQLRAFVADHCGLVNRDAACRCERRVATAIRIGRVEPDGLLFAGALQAEEAVTEMEHLHDLASLMRSHPDYEAPETLLEAVRSALTSGQFRILE